MLYPWKSVLLSIFHHDRTCSQNEDNGGEGLEVTGTRLGRRLKEHGRNIGIDWKEVLSMTLGISMDDFPISPAQCLSMKVELQSIVSSVVHLDPDNW